MTFGAIRRGMNSLWGSANREADSLRDPLLALERMRGAYQRLDGREREWADQVICEWVLSDEEAKRYDALVLVRELCLTRAAPALLALISRLESSGDAGASFERDKARAVLSGLATAGGP